MKLPILDAGMKADLANAVPEQREGEAVVAVATFVENVFTEKHLEFLDGELELPCLFQVGKELRLEFLLQAVRDGVIGLVEPERLLRLDQETNEISEGSGPLRYIAVVGLFRFDCFVYGHTYPREPLRCNFQAMCGERRKH